MELSWFGRSIIATICFAPIMIASKFFYDNYQVRPEATIIWYSVGLVLGAIPIAVYTGLLSPKELMPSPILLLIFLLMGATLGTASNLLLFQALSTAPNPSLPMAITNAVTPLVLISSVALSVLLPQYFGAVKIDGIYITGIMLVLSGVTIIAMHR